MRPEGIPELGIASGDSSLVSDVSPPFRLGTPFLEDIECRVRKICLDILGSGIASRVRVPSSPGSAFSGDRTPSRRCRATDEDGLDQDPHQSNRHFHPMRAILSPPWRDHLDLEHQTDHHSHSSGSPEATFYFSPRYHGRHVASNASADHLTDEQNCAVFIRGLPPDVTYHELLGSIPRVGRVWRCFINGPTAQHATSAAKLVFYHPRSAAALLAHASSPGLTVRRRYRASACYNRIKSPRDACARYTSRVVMVTGHWRVVNPEALTDLFRRHFSFELDEASQIARVGRRAVVEYRFGSYGSQAQAARMVIERSRVEGIEAAEFGLDPCEVGEDLSMYNAALMRARGVGIEPGRVWLE